MRGRSLAALAAAALFALAGCGNDGSGALEGPLAYSRGGGLDGTAERLTIQPDGAATFETDHGLKQESKDFKRRDPHERDQIAKLASEVDRRVDPRSQARSDSRRLRTIAVTYATRDDGLMAVGHQDPDELGRADARRWATAPRSLLGRTLRGRRPLLLIDVDGVLSLFGAARAPGCRDARRRHPAPALAPRRGARTDSGRFECVWCTGWEDRADTHLPHLLGLPRGWPHIALPGVASRSRTGSCAGIDAYAGRDRPLAWIDDAP